ncbi:uncharacterized protein LOC143891221 [Tasmannia lanceolata]|uniref:uncharacterized protein LOC143858765 n=1 Tax=Tasmannia lanceolata TaxID=3420 RepID=UPI004063A9C7
MPPSPPLELRTTAHVIKHSSLSFLSSFYTFLILSLLLFSFKNTVENGTRFLTSFLDKDPSVQTLISRLSSDLPRQTLAGKSNPQQHSVKSPAGNPRRRRPFLHLSRVGTLDDDFFSENDDFNTDRQISRHRRNGSFVNYGNYSKLGFPEKGGEIRVLEIAGSGFLFVTDDLYSNETGVSDEDQALDLWFLGLGLGLDRQDTAALFFLVTFLSAAYGWLILGFLFSYCYVLGVVFFAVVNSQLGKENSIFGTLRAGSRLGIRRVLGFALLRWAVRDALTQFLGLWFFSDLEDQYLLFKLFVHLKVMPFSVASLNWGQGSVSGVEVSMFLFVWVLLDSFVALVFAVDCWVAIMDTRRSGQEILKEGCYLISTMSGQAIGIKCLESFICGSVVRWVLTQIGGNVFALFFQSVGEVYFMVVWLMFYFAARCKDAEMEGRTFGERDLEDCINGLR